MINDDNNNCGFESFVSIHYNVTSLNCQFIALTTVMNTFIDHRNGAE